MPSPPSSKTINQQRQLPLWLVVTKGDRIDGFSDFFAEMSGTDATQAVGWVYSWKNPNVLEPNEFRIRWNRLSAQFGNWKGERSATNTSVHPFVGAVRSFGNLFGQTVISLFENQAGRLTGALHPTAAIGGLLLTSCYKPPGATSLGSEQEPEPTPLFVEGIFKFLPEFEWWRPRLKIVFPIGSFP